MALLSSKEVAILKSLARYIKEYTPPDSANSKISDEIRNNQNLTSLNLTSDSTYHDLINSSLTADELTGILSPELLLYKRIHDINKFLDGPYEQEGQKNESSYSKAFINFLLVRWKNFTDKLYFQNFVKDIKAVLESQKQDLIKRYNQGKPEDTKMSLDTNIADAEGFKYEKQDHPFYSLSKKDPGLAMYSLLNSYRNLSSDSVFLNNPYISNLYDGVQRIFQPNNLRALLFLILIVGMFALPHLSLPIIGTVMLSTYIIYPVIAELVPVLLYSIINYFRDNDKILSGEKTIVANVFNTGHGLDRQNKLRLQDNGLGNSSKPQGEVLENRSPPQPNSPRVRTS